MIRPLAQDAVTLRPLPPSGEAGSTSELAVQGRRAPQPLAGAVLEAAFDADGRRYLVFTSDDIPYEDSLHVHLLDEQLQLLDSASLSAMYSTGAFQLIGAEPPNAVRFRFFGDTDWTVELLDSAAMRWPVISEPRGVHRKFGFVRHFKIHGNPQPERAVSGRGR